MQIQNGHLKDLTRGMMINAIAQDRAGAVRVFRKHGVPMPEDTPITDMYMGAIVGAGNSSVFKKDLKNFVVSKLITDGVPSVGGDESSNGKSANFVEQQGMGADGSISTIKGSPVRQFVDKYSNYLGADGQGDSKGVFTGERIGSYLDAGMNLIFTALGRKAQRESEAAAIDMEKASAEKFKAIGEAAANTTDTKSKWIKPVLIGTAFIAVGLGIFIVYKMAKKKD